MLAWAFTLGGFLKNLIPTQFRILLNPWVLVITALVLSHGYAFSRGKSWERRSQANAVLDLNMRLAKNEVKDAKEEAVAAKKETDAVLEAKKHLASEPVKQAACSLDEGSIRRIRAIVKSAQVTP